ncbi:hypothetical protein DV736_g2503, partial [Chaetothyriales sp. CBS 134916]
MSKKKSQRKPTASVWPYTPEPSPPLEAPRHRFDKPEKFRMASEEHSKAVPISTGRKERLHTTARPSLEDVLNNVAPPPYTLAAYTAFLSQQHCLETLEFVTESRKYREKYRNAATKLGGTEVTTESDDGFELMMDWTRLLDVYVKPGAPREINLPAEERDDLVEQPYEPKLPPPEALNPSVKRMYDLMSDSIFIPFCNSLKKVPTHSQTYNPLSDWSIREGVDGNRTLDGYVGRHQRSPSNPSISPPPSSFFAPSRSPPSQHQTQQSSSLSSALGRQSGNRLSTHVSNSSARSAPTSDAALTDSSGGDRDSPVPGEQDSVMTPPTTPPTSDLGTGNQATLISATSHPLKPQRSESGGWKRMGMKFFGGKQRRGGPGD